MRGRPETGQSALPTLRCLDQRLREPVQHSQAWLDENPNKSGSGRVMVTLG